MAAEGEWREVRHRRRSPTNRTPPTVQESDLVHPYIPFFSKKSFAQAVSGGSVGSQSESGGTISNRSSPHNSRPSSPAAPQRTQSYPSPHSPTTLRFPPQPSFLEWRGRCFRCLRVGHPASKCCNQLRCGRCWKEGHVLSKCATTKLNPQAKPFSPAMTKEGPTKTSFSTRVSMEVRAPQSASTNTHQPALTSRRYGKAVPEPDFQNLISKDQPYRPLPDDRLEKIQVFMPRDAAYYAEIEKLSKAVVIQGVTHTTGLQPEQAVRIAVDTGLVREEEIRVASLARGRTLIHLPRGLKVDTFIRALPVALWDQGFIIQPWSESEGAAIMVPRFKVLIDLVDFPIQIWRENEVKKAVSSMGIYLGTVQPTTMSDLSSSRVALATDDLSKVAKTMGLIIGGMEHEVVIRPVTWETGAVYTASDFPKNPIRYSRPSSPQPPSTTDSLTERSSGPERSDPDLIWCSRRALREMCMTIDPNLIPPEITEVILGPEKAAELPLELLSDMVMSHDFGSQYRNKPQHSNAQAGRKEGGERVASQRATQRRFNEPITPDLSILFREDQPCEMRQPSVLEATKDSTDPVDPVDLSSGATEIPQVLEENRDKRRKPIDKGLSSSKDVAGQLIEERGKRLDLVTGIQTQKIMPDTNNGTSSNNQGRRILSQSAFASRHTRFASLAGQGKGKAKMGSSQPIRKKCVAGQLVISEAQGEASGHKHRQQQITTVTTHVTKAKKGDKKSTETCMALVNVPVKIVTGRLQGPTTIGSNNITPTKRKPAVQIPKAGSNSTKPAKQARLQLDPEGYYKVQVGKTLCKTIGEECGLQALDVERALLADNEARQAESNKEKELAPDDEMEWGDHQFDPESEDELFSDPEM